jgi:hypothetical protein
MSAGTDPTFYRSPAEAIAAPPERLASVAAFDPAGRSRDAMAVADGDPARPTTARWSAGQRRPRPATSSTLRLERLLQRPGDNGHGQPLERRYLVVPGIWSSRISVPDTRPDPRHPGCPGDPRRRAGRQGRLLPAPPLAPRPDRWAVTKVLTIPAEPADPELPPARQPLGRCPR